MKTCMALYNSWFHYVAFLVITKQLMLCRLLLQYNKTALYNIIEVNYYNIQTIEFNCIQ